MADATTVPSTTIQVHLAHTDDPQQGRPGLWTRRSATCAILLAGLALVSLQAWRGAPNHSSSSSSSSLPIGQQEEGRPAGTAVRRVLQTQRLVSTGRAPWTPPSATQLARLDRSLGGLATSFDPSWNLTTVSVAGYSPGYATKLTTGIAHPTKDSLWYALGLLDTGRDESVATAVAIIRRVLPLQDTNSSSKTLGTWPWFTEEPISKMGSPDMNWVDFCGLTLLETLRDHQSRLPTDLSEAMWDSVLIAARASMKRNVDPSYTNVCVMGTALAIIAGETLKDATLRSYGVKRLQRFYNYTMSNGGFTEYNSPPYTPVMINELSRLRSEVQDASLYPTIDQLLRRAWQEFATHFHFPTWQWAGPHSRNYATLLRRSNLALVDRGSGGNVTFSGVDVPSREERRVIVNCPPDLWPLFTSLNAPRVVISNFIPATNTVGTTYLHPLYTLGSINHGDMWNQRRALVAYFNTASKPMYLHLRFLKDNYDFASAYLTSSQQDGKVVGAVTFFNNGGDTHISLNMVKNGTIRASDLRLRFELGGPADLIAAARLTTTGTSAATITAGAKNITFNILVPYAQFDAWTGKLSTGISSTGDAAYVDVVLYSGSARDFTLTSMQEAALAFVLSTSTAPTSPLTAADASLTLRSPAEAKALQLFVPLLPAPSTIDSSALTVRSGNLSITVPTKPLTVVARKQLDSQTAAKRR